MLAGSVRLESDSASTAVSGIGAKMTIGSDTVQVGWLSSTSMGSSAKPICCWASGASLATR
eukprot:6048679-Amphidinium_carterae.1